MPEMIDVLPDEIIESAWGNAIRDRTVQRYASAGARDSSDPAPVAGQVSYVADAGSVEVFHGGVWNAFTPVGVVTAYAGTTAPSGWILCRGQAISRATFARLFGVIGSTYGGGDGTTTFNVPDLQQRFPMGKAASGTGSTLGSTGGAINHVHSGPSHTHSGPSHTHLMAAHQHNISFPTRSTSGSSAANTGLAGGHGHTTGGPSATVQVPTGTAVGVGSANHTHTVNSAGSHSHTMAHTHTVEGFVFVSAFSGSSDPTGASGTGNTGAAGTGNTGQANPPYLVLNWIIKT